MEDYSIDYTHYPKNIDYAKELLILGEPIHTFYGTFRFFSYQEYIANLYSLSVIKTTGLGFYYEARRELINNNAPLSARQELKKTQNTPLTVHIKTRPEVAIHYIRVINQVLISDLFDDEFTYENLLSLNDEDLLNIRKIILEMNLLKEERMSPSVKVQDRLDMDKKFKSAQNDAPNTETIFSSIFVYTGAQYEEIKKMTAYQVISTFYRIHAINDFNTTVLFTSVGAEVPWKKWDENSDLLEDKINGMSGREFNKKIGGLFE